MVLARSHASPSKFGKIQQCGTTQVNFYIGGTDPGSPGSIKERNWIVLSEEHHVLTTLNYLKVILIQSDL